MKITFDWLKDHLKTNLKEKNLLDQLTNIGLEVESVENLSAENELFKYKDHQNEIVNYAPEHVLNTPGAKQRQKKSSIR